MIRQFIARHRGNVLIRNAGWMFGGQILSVLTQGIYFIVLARVLGVSEYGLIVGVSALTGIASQYGSLGFGFVFLRHVGPDRSLFGVYWGNILGVTIVTGSLIVLLIATIGHLTLPQAGISLLVLVALGDCLFNQLTSCCAQVFQTFEQMRITATLILCSNVLRMAAAVLFLVTTRTATAMQWATASVIISAILAAAAIWIVVRRFGRPQLDPRRMMAHLGEGVIFAVSGSSTVVYNDLDKAMLGHYGMNAANGVYTMAYRVLDIAFMPIRSIHSAAFPKFFRLGSIGVSNAEEFARNLQRRTLVLGFAAATGMFLCAPIVPHLVGKSFDDSISAIRWLCLIPVLRCLHIAAGDAMAGAGHQRVRLVLQACAAGFNFALNLWLIPQYSWRGAAWASLCTDGLLAASSWTVLLVMKRREQARLSKSRLDADPVPG